MVTHVNRPPPTMVPHAVASNIGMHSAQTARTRRDATGPPDRSLVNRETMVYSWPIQRPKIVNGQPIRICYRCPSYYLVAWMIDRIATLDMVRLSVIAICRNLNIDDYCCNRQRTSDHHWSMDIVRACPAIRLVVTAALDLVEQLRKKKNKREIRHY